MLPALVIGAGVLLVLAMSGKRSTHGSTALTPEQQAAVDAQAAADKAAADKAAVDAKTTSDVLTGVTIAVSAVGTLAPIAIKIGTAFAAAGGTTAAAGTATGGATTAGTTAAAGATTVGATGGATAGEVASGVATGVVVAAEIIEAPLIGFAAALVVIVAFIAIWIGVETANAPAKLQGDKGIHGTKRAYATKAFTWEEDFITDIMLHANHPVNKALIADEMHIGSGLYIPTQSYFITSFAAEPEVQRVLIDIGRWYALTRVEAFNDFMRHCYFVRDYPLSHDDPNRTVEESVAEANQTMSSLGYALTEYDFNYWRDNEYFPALKTRAWKTETVVPAIGRRGVTTTMIYTVFDKPDMYWQECVNVANARLPNATGTKASLRVLGFSLAMYYLKGVNNLTNDQYKSALMRAGGFKKVATNDGGDYSYVDIVSGWHFSPNLSLYNAEQKLIHAR